MHHGTRQAAVDGYASACCDLDLSPLTRKPNQCVSWPR